MRDRRESLGLGDPSGLLLLRNVEDDDDAAISVRRRLWRALLFGGIGGKKMLLSL